ncbi:urea ABC transporter permease subunit UrtB [Halovibrio salipaludis]|uniref:Urea ABC transporter permease subunit UrtB n=1 Tax=Halovibrio salipaludis TaxID=2032626 RepID=A0A2A2EU87_9GAMM|nr:urea ABC transporter permease subunit UrtB [Halovibrio salipaludis]PAU75853.1 urea ABC transporter permease subunit UrtB [Halovibrio salipaludis]
MGGYTTSEIATIMAMQGIAGLSLFGVFLLMALGLAIIFGQMGVINMAHGEFLTLGSYATYVVATMFESYAPGLFSYYFPVAIVLSFLVAFGVGYLLEYGLVRHLYKRPLDTLLATWAVGLIMQQIFRSIFGGRGVSADAPDWLQGSIQLSQMLFLSRSDLFVMCIAIAMTVIVAILLYRARWGMRVRSTTQNRAMANAVGINTAKVDRNTFALGCGLAGIAGSAFTTISATTPTAGAQYLVDTFLVVVLGGAASLLGTVASAFSIAQAQSILEFFITGSMAKVLTLMVVIGIIMLRPQGLFTLKVRQ